MAAGLVLVTPAKLTRVGVVRFTGKTIKGAGVVVVVVCLAVEVDTVVTSLLVVVLVVVVDVDWEVEVEAVVVSVIPGLEPPVSSSPLFP